jgi:hypothetical protein
MGHSEVDKARLLENGDVEISLVLPNCAKGRQLVIHAIVTQDALAGRTDRALAHTSFMFVPSQDGQTAVFTVRRDPASPPFSATVGIEARAEVVYGCWSTLDGAGQQPAAEGWTWELGEWS